MDVYNGRIFLFAVLQLFLSPLTKVAGGCVKENLPLGYTQVTSSSTKAYRVIRDQKVDAHSAQYLCRKDGASIAMPKTAAELNEIKSLNSESSTYHEKSQEIKLNNKI